MGLRATRVGPPPPVTPTADRVGILHELSQTISPQELELRLGRVQRRARGDLQPQLVASTTRCHWQIARAHLRAALPFLMKRRDYIIAWWRLALARSAHETLINSPQPATPVRRQDFNPLHFGEQQQQQRAAGQQQQQGEPVSLTPTQRTALKRLLDGYGAPRPAVDGAWEVLVPNEHLHIVCSQVSQLTGQSTPRQPRARREWLADVVRQIS